MVAKSLSISSAVNIEFTNNFLFILLNGNFDRFSDVLIASRVLLKMESDELPNTFFKKAKSNHVIILI